MLINLYVGFELQLQIRPLFTMSFKVENGFCSINLFLFGVFFSYSKKWGVLNECYEAKFFQKKLLNTENW